MMSYFSLMYEIVSYFRWPILMIIPGALSQLSSVPLYPMKVVCQACIEARYRYQATLVGGMCVMFFFVNPHAARS